MWPVDAEPEELAALGDRFLLSALPDGWRCLVVLDDRVRLRSRSGRDLAPHLPRLAGAIADLRSARHPGATTTVLDAVLVLPPDPPSAPFAGLDAVEELQLLDVLCWEGRVVTGAPVAERSRLLQRAPVGGRVRGTELWRGPARDALEQLRCGGRRTAAALLAREPASPYRPGVRSPEWRRCGAPPLVEFVLCGIADSGALVLGMPAPGGLAYAGSCWPTRAWSHLAARCVPGAPVFSAREAWPSLGEIRWAEPTLWVAVRPDVRPGSGRGGPRWAFVRVQEDLSAPCARAGAASGDRGRADGVVPEVGP